MAHRKSEYDANGHEVTIQQVNEGGGISAWIDGLALSWDEAIDHITNSKTPGDLSVSEKIDHLYESGETWKAIETLAAWMCDCHVYYCNNCGQFYDHNDVGRTKFAGHICGDCHRENQECPDSPDGEHKDECLNPSKKRNARVATKYRCEHCGRKRQTVPTG